MALRQRRYNRFFAHHDSRNRGIVKSQSAKPDVNTPVLERRRVDGARGHQRLRGDSAGHANHAPAGDPLRRDRVSVARGHLAVGTWVVAEVLMLTAGKLPGFGFGSGTSLPIPIVKEFGASAGARMTHFYIMAFVLALTAFGATWLLLRSRFGLGLTAMLDNEEAAGSAGVDLTFSRAACFLWTAPILGFVGVLVTLQKLRVAPTASFSITDWTIYIIFIAVIGGVGSLERPT
jgi:ABC-type branched-subunit amino acid transport system permease subunit